MNNMKRRLLALVLLTTTLATHSQEYERVLLRPEVEGTEIFIYRSASKAVTPAIIIFPGGGYQTLAINHEGHDMARWYAGCGITAVVVKYRMPNGNHTIPLADAELAVEFVRSHAAELNINPRRVGIVGSSAGGHLAASLSTLAAPRNRPDFAILYYPVITMENGITHAGSKANLLGPFFFNASLLRRFSLEYQVDPRTPPTLLLLSGNDSIVIPENSIRYYSALQRNNIPASMHIFPVGGHGWGFGSSFPYHEEVKRIIEKWIGFDELKTNLQAEN
jgi:acetyl esterase/lipase